MTENEMTAAPGALPTTGGALRTLRESQQLSLEEVSSRIKFSVRQIRALEEDRWDELPTGISLRGLVRSYARVLGADGEALAASIVPPQAGAARKPGAHADTGTSPIAASSRVPLAADEGHSGVAWGWLFVILLFILAGAAYGFWQGWLPQHWLPAGWL